MAIIDRKYHQLLQHIIKNGYDYGDPNRKNVVRKEVQSVQIEHKFSDGFPVLTTKRVYWKAVVGELLWFLRGDTNIKYLLDNNINIWNKDAYNHYKNDKFDYSGESFEEWLKIIKDGGETFGDAGRIYGAQWRNFSGSDESGYTTRAINQITNLIEGLKTNPMSTRHIVTAWNPAELDRMALPPCHWSFEILVKPLSPIQTLELSVPGERIGKEDDPLSFVPRKGPKHSFILKWHQRSVDTFLGLPFNIASYALLAKIIEGMTGIHAEGIVGDLSNVHIYYPHMSKVLEQLGRGINEFHAPQLKINASFDGEVDDVINNLKIEQFTLKNYKSFPALPAEMLPYDK